MQALRHSKVKLTWDEDDPERNRITRRALSKQEIEEADFKALIASSESESESEAEIGAVTKKDKRTAERDKLRALLLGGNDDAMPEGWASKVDEKDSKDIDMEITFAPGFSTKPRGEDEETTLEKYQRKMKEKRKQRKEEGKAKDEDTEETKKKKKRGISVEDDFFGAASGDENEEVDSNRRRGKGTKDKKNKNGAESLAVPRVASTVEELALLTGGDELEGGTKHFDMKAVLKAEKKKGKKTRKGKKGKAEDDGPDEIQEEFVIDVKDDRFKALHDDYTFAIDPSNPQ
jgi:hypothetical protein